MQCTLGIVLAIFERQGMHMKKQIGLMAVLGLAIVALAADQAGKSYKTDD